MLESSTPEECIAFLEEHTPDGTKGLLMLLKDGCPDTVGSDDPDPEGAVQELVWDGWSPLAVIALKPKEEGPGVHITPLPEWQGNEAVEKYLLGLAADAQRDNHREGGAPWRIETSSDMEWPPPGLFDD